MASMPRPQEIIYPESDGQPMADNTKQCNWIETIKGGLEGIFENRPDVFVAGNLLWYPVEGKPKIRAAPDAMVAFGRPKGDRGSYRQWVEGNIAPQVVFEILSPGNNLPEMEFKRRFYERYGVQEYYIYNPDNFMLTGWLRQGRKLKSITEMNGWKSPLLDIHFELDGPNGELNIYDSEGRRFSTYLVVYKERKQAEQRAEQERQRAEQERQRAEQAEVRVTQAEQEREQERQRAEQAEVRVTQAEQEREQERQRAEQAEQQREQERQRAEKLLARLRAEGINLDDL